MPRTVIVYSHERRSACRLVKEFLSQRGVTYILKDVSRDPEAAREFLATRALLPPVVVVDGQIVAGYDPARLEMLLEEGEGDDRE